MTAGIESFGRRLSLSRFRLALELELCVPFAIAYVLFNALMFQAWVMPILYRWTRVIELRALPREQLHLGLLP